MHTIRPDLPPISRQAASSRKSSAAPLELAIPIAPRRARLRKTNGALVGVQAVQVTPMTARALRARRATRTAGTAPRMTRMTPPARRMSVGDAVGVIDRRKRLQRRRNVRENSVRSLKMTLTYVIPSLNHLPPSPMTRLTCVLARTWLDDFGRLEWKGYALGAKLV